MDGHEKLQEMTIPLEGLSKQIDRLTQWKGPTDGHASHLDLG